MYHYNRGADLEQQVETWPAAKLANWSAHRRMWGPSFTVLLLAALGGPIGTAAQAQVFTEPTTPTAPQQREQSSDIDATVYFPFNSEGFEAAERTRKQSGARHHLVIGAGRSITYDGRSVTLVELSTLIRKNKSDRYIETIVVPRSDASFGQTVKVLSIFNRFGDSKFRIQGNEQFDRIFVAPPLKMSESGKIEFRNRFARERLFPFSVSWRSHPINSCSISFFGRMMNSDEHAKYAYMVLDANLKINWMEPNSRQRSDYPRAAIQAKANAPWKCVGGAMYNLEIAGYPTIMLQIDDMG